MSVTPSPTLPRVIYLPFFRTYTPDTYFQADSALLVVKIAHPIELF